MTLQPRLLDELEDKPQAAPPERSEGGAERPEVERWRGLKAERDALSGYLFAAPIEEEYFPDTGQTLWASETDEPVKKWGIGGRWFEVRSGTTVARLRRWGERMRACAQDGRIRCDQSGNTTVSPDLCHVRGCPICEAQHARARRDTYREALEAAATVPGTSLVFVTRTQVAEPNEDLIWAINRITTARGNFQKANTPSRQWQDKHIAGGLWAMEATRNKHCKWWHVHYHELWLVRDDLLKGALITEKVKGKKGKIHKRVKVRKDSPFFQEFMAHWDSVQNYQLLSDPTKRVSIDAQDMTVIRLGEREGQDDPLGELLKYPVKYQTLAGADCIEAFGAFRGHRTVGVFGSLHASSRFAQMERPEDNHPNLWAWTVGEAYRTRRKYASERDDTKNERFYEAYIPDWDNPGSRRPLRARHLVYRTSIKGLEKVPVEWVASRPDMVPLEDKSLTIREIQFRVGWWVEVMLRDKL